MRVSEENICLVCGKVLKIKKFMDQWEIEDHECKGEQKMKEINPSKVDYTTFRNWLQEISHLKETYNAKMLKKRKIDGKMRELRKEISELYTESQVLKKETDEIREGLVKAIPNKFG